MEYLLSFLYPSTSSINECTIKNEKEPIVNGENNKIVNVDKYREEKKVISDFLIKYSASSNHTFTPAGGGVHDLKDSRVKKLYNDAMSERIYRDFIDDINSELPKLLKKEMAKNNLTQNAAKKCLINYLYKNI